MEVCQSYKPMVFDGPLAPRDVLTMLDPEDRAALSAIATSVHVSAGATLFRQGEVGDTLYLLLQGRLSVTITHEDGSATVVDVLAPGESVGEMALLTGQRRAATVVALDDAELAMLTRADFQQLTSARPNIRAAMAQAARPRLQRTQIANLLTALFGELDTIALHELQAALQWRRLRAGQVLFSQGEAGAEMYILVSGRLRLVTSDATGAQRIVGELGRGEMVGEMSVLTGEPRSATVVAMRDSDLVQLAQATFEQLLARYPHAMMQISRTIARRMHRILSGASRPPARATTFAVVAASRGAPVTAFTRRLVQTLAAGGSTLHLNRARFETADLPDDDPASVALLAWMTDQEASHQYVVYEADLEPSAWTARCLRQADRILLLANADEAPGGAPRDLAAPDALSATHTRAELVLVQPEGCSRPARTARWLARHQVRAHHHLRLEHAGDWRRLGRRLTGQACGLVLEGGGARGFAHIGVARALSEAGIEIDVLGGTSMGGLMAGMIAMDYTPAEMVELARLFGSRRKLLDLTPPLVSFYATHKLTRALQHIYGETRIEDVWRPFFCVSTNLTRAEAQVHEDGRLWEALRASAAIPAIFAPVLHGGDVLVDGGVLNNLPLDLMRERCAGGPVIAVSTSSAADREPPYRFGPSVSGWGMLLGRLVPEQLRVSAPSVFDTILRSVTVGNTQRMRSAGYRQLADVFLELPVERYDILDFDAYEAIIEAGYRAIQPRAAEIAAQVAAVCRARTNEHVAC